MTYLADLEKKLTETSTLASRRLDLLMKSSELTSTLKVRVKELSDEIEKLKPSVRNLWRDCQNDPPPFNKPVALKFEKNSKRLYAGERVNQDAHGHNYITNNAIPTHFAGVWFDVSPECA